MAFVVRRTGSGESEPRCCSGSTRIGKTQRLAELQFVDELPRSHIGKVLKRELRELHRGTPAPR